MSIAAAAGAVSRSVRDILAEREEKRQQQLLEAARQEQLRMEQDRLGLAKRGFEVDETYRAGQRRTQEAGIMADLIGPGRELTSEQASAFRDTPYAALLDEQRTLPSRTIAAAGGADLSDPGGRQHVTLRPTRAQEREQGQRTELESFANDPNLPVSTRRYLQARRLGVNAPNPESFESPAERDARERRQTDAAFGDFQRRTDYQAGIAEAARRRAVQDRTVTPRDRVQALRQADAAAADYLSTLTDDFGMLPDGVDADAIRQQFIDEYVDALEYAPGKTSRGETRRILGELSRIVPAPGRSDGSPSRRLMGDLIPVGSGRSAGATTNRTTGGGDAWEQYLARTGGR